jgi:non-specific serine/threonine protein kinase
MQRIGAEANNLRAAFAWSLGPEGDLELGLSAAAALWWFWWTHGQVGEGRQWLHALLERGEEAGLSGASAFARALLGAGILAYFAGDFEGALPQFEQARGLGARLGEPITEGYALFMIGTVEMFSRQHEAGHAHIQQASALLSRARPAADWYVGVTSLAQTLLCFEQGDVDEAQRQAEAGMATFAGLGQPYGIGLAHNYLGDVARARGHLARAAECYQAALPLLRLAHARSEIPAVLHNYAHVLLAQGDHARAQSLFVEALELHRAIGNRMGMVECLVGLALAAATLGASHRAATLLGAAETLQAALNMPLFAAEQALYRQAAAAARQALGATAWTEAHSAGRALALPEALSVAASAL